MREPDLTIGPKANPYMLRWHLLRWRGVQIALHNIRRSDDDRALHDHSSWNISVILWGRYEELTPSGVKRRWMFIPYWRPAELPHRLILRRGPVWTIWLRGKPWREWGFHCSRGWRHWRDFVSGDYNKPGAVSEAGPGCG